MTDVLPSPPNGHARWSVVTLAEHLRVRPAVVDALLEDPTDAFDSSPDLCADRAGISYADASGESCGDCWLWTEAAERIAAQLPAARIARAVIAAEPLDAVETIGGPALRAMAEHILTHSGT